MFSEIRPANKRFAIVDFESSNYVVSTKLMVLRCNEQIYNKFLYIYLTSYEVLEYLQMIAEDRSGTFPQITFDNIANMSISLPPLPEQIRIASILSSLDDKIDLLHRENKTLEAMAETLFRQWFIEEAKEDWEEKTLGKCLKLVGGGTPKTSEERFWNGKVCWLSGGDIANNHKSFVSCSETSGVTVSELEVSGQKTEFVVGDAFDEGEIKVVAKLSDNTSLDVTKDAKVSAPASLESVGTYAVIVTYKAFSTSYQINVAPVAAEANLMVDASAAKTAYVIGEQASAEGAKVYHVSGASLEEVAISECQVKVVDAQGNEVNGPFAVSGTYIKLF